MRTIMGLKTKKVSLVVFEQDANAARLHSYKDASEHRLITGSPLERCSGQRCTREFRHGSTVRWRAVLLTCMSSRLQDLICGMHTNHQIGRSSCIEAIHRFKTLEIVAETTRPGYSRFVLCLRFSLSTLSISTIVRSSPHIRSRRQDNTALRRS